MKDRNSAQSAIPFKAFAQFQRIETANPIFYCPPPDWAAAAHAIVEGDTIHYLWARRDTHARRWTMMHSSAPASAPAAVQHDPRNPILKPVPGTFDSTSTEYPFPFRNPADGKLYAYYLGRNDDWVKQTGLLASNGDFGAWTRARPTPVIAAETDFESNGSAHPSVAIEGDTIHILYTGESDNPPVICHATASTHDPAAVAKDADNPIFCGTGEAWDSQGVREAEIFKGPQFFHIFYGGSDGEVWRIGHVRTRDFRTIDPNPHNPIFTPSLDPEAWDGDGLLTPQVFQIGDSYWMLYAGMKGKEWQSGLAVTRKLPANA